MPFRFGCRVRTTVDQIGRDVPAGSYGTVIYPLDTWGDCGVPLDGDSANGTHVYGQSELILIADAPDWLKL